MTVFEVPTTPGTPQQFTITMQGVTYTLRLHWCDPGSVWVLDIMDENQVPILQGVPLVTGADLLGQFSYLNFGGMLVVQSDPEKEVPPDFDGLGSTGHLYFVIPDPVTSRVFTTVPEAPPPS